MLNIEKKTKLRFKTCDGNKYSEWKEIQIGEILTERKEYSEKNKNYPHFSLTKEGVVPKSERYERDFLVKNEKKAYKITHLNDICYNPANLKFGVIAKNDLGSGIFSPIYITFTVHKEVNPTYLDLYIRYSDFIKRARRYEEGTVYERKAVQPTDFIKVKITIPCLEEQNKIAEFFSKFDELITFYQQHLEIAQKIKKGFLQKLFPEKSENTPKVRFKDDDENYPEWAEKSLNKIADIYDGTHQTPKYVETGIPFYSVENITNNNFINTKFISKKEYIENNKKRRIEKNDILMTRIGSIGESKLIDWNVTADFYVSLALIKLKDVAYPNYINQFIKTSFFQKELSKRTLKVAFPQKINLTEIGDCLVKLPYIEEQKKIASFLSSIDKQVENIEKKIKNLENIKKGLLQQMFV